MNLRFIFIAYFFNIYLLLYSFEFVSPKEFMVVRENSMKLLVIPSNESKEPDSVFFSINYSDQHKKKIRLKADNNRWLIWDYIKYPDGKYFVNAEVWNNGRKKILGIDKDNKGRIIKIDRNPNNKRITAKAYYSDIGKEYHFLNGSDTTFFTISYTKNALLINLRITDKYLNLSLPQYKEIGGYENYMLKLWKSDGIELCFDLDHDHNIFKTLNDRELIVDISGNFQGNVWNRKLNSYSHWGDEVSVDVKILGTVNNNENLDEGYLISIVIPFEELKINPSKGDTIGFDVQSFDKDYSNDISYRAIWSGAAFSNNDNPSEWGNLVFSEKETKSGNYLYSVIIGGLFIILLVVFIYYFYNSKSEKIIPEEEKEEEINDDNLKIRQIKKYVNKNFYNHNLGRPMIADYVGLSEKYLSTLFKTETGINLNEYINKKRIEKAEQLIKNSRLNISQIAEKVGYNSVQNFNRSFKRNTNYAPSEYRQKFSKK